MRLLQRRTDSSESNSKACQQKHDMPQTDTGASAEQQAPKNPADGGNGSFLPMFDFDEIEALPYIMNSVS